MHLVILALQEAAQRGNIARDEVMQRRLTKSLSCGRQFCRRFYKDGHIYASKVLRRRGEKIAKSIESSGETKVFISKSGDEVLISYTKTPLDG